MFRPFSLLYVVVGYDSVLILEREMIENEMMTVNEVAEKLRVKRHWVYKQIKEGGFIRKTQINRKILFRRVDVDAWVASHTEE